MNRAGEVRRAQELEGLGQLIALAGEVFPNCGVGIEGSRHYGLGLLAHGVEIARAIRLCVRKNLPGPAFALARALYEAVLRGHVIVHEIGLTELNELLVRTQQWHARSPDRRTASKDRTSRKSVEVCRSRDQRSSGLRRVATLSNRRPRYSFRNRWWGCDFSTTLPMEG